jgi:transcriptional regulator of arginine metabolism
MSKLILDSGASRRSLIIELVESGVIHSQSDLVKALARKGIKVTQATASRDLEELGAVRGKDASGVFRYQFIASTEATSNNLKNLVLEIDASGNLAVVKTPPGAAQLLAGQLDRAIKNGAIAGIGTIAGDDTIMVIAKSATGGSALAKAIDRFVSENQNMKRVR